MRSVRRRWVLVRALSRPADNKNRDKYIGGKAPQDRDFDDLGIAGDFREKVIHDPASFHGDEGAAGHG